MIRIVFLQLICYSCIDIIEFETDTTESISIYGRLTNSGNHDPYVTVSFSETTDGLQ